MFSLPIIQTVDFEAPGEVSEVRCGYNQKENEASHRTKSISPGASAPMQQVKIP